MSFLTPEALPPASASFSFQKPDPAGLAKFLKPLNEVISKANAMIEGKRSDFFNHFKAAVDSLSALAWIAFTEKGCGMSMPIAHIEESWQMAEFYSNKVQYGTQQDKRLLNQKLLHLVHLLPPILLLLLSLVLNLLRLHSLRSSFSCSSKRDLRTTASNAASRSCFVGEHKLKSYEAHLLEEYSSYFMDQTTLYSSSSLFFAICQEKNSRIMPSSLQPIPSPTMFGGLFAMTVAIVQMGFHSSSPLDTHPESVWLSIIALFVFWCASEYHGRHQSDLLDATTPLNFSAKLIFASASLAYAALIALLLPRILESLVFSGWVMVLLI